MNAPKLISSVWEINGEIVHVGEGTPEQIDPALYDENGWSLEMRFGCVRNKAIDEYLNIMAIGDKYQQEQARVADRWFAVFLPDREYDDATRKLLIRNYQQDSGSPTSISGGLGKMMMEQFYAHITRDMTDTYPPFTYVYTDEQEGFATPIFGSNPYRVHMFFVEKHLVGLEQGIASMKYHEKYGAPRS